MNCVNLIIPRLNISPVKVPDELVRFDVVGRVLVDLTLLRVVDLLLFTEQKSKV